MANHRISFFSRKLTHSKYFAMTCTMAICALVWPVVAMSGSAPKASTMAARTANTMANGPWDDGRVAVGGSTFAGLTAQFWRWLYSIPLGVDPNSDTSGANCGINQPVGDVWFLAGPFGIFTGNCTIPAGKRIVSAVNASLDDYPCPDPLFKPAPGQSLEDFLLQDIGPFVDGVTNVAAQIDGRPLRVRRIKTELFSFTAAGNRIAFDPCVTGSPQLGVSDGYFVFIDPLPHGDHVLQLRSVGPPPEGANLGTVYLKIR